MSTAVLRTNARERALSALTQLPPFSPVLNRLLVMLAKDDVSFGRLAALIEKDTVLAGNVLRLVNSALYGREASINSVGHAIAIIGIEKLRNVALSLSVQRVWGGMRIPRSFVLARFNSHSVATGVFADQLAQMVPIAYPEGAFAAGLFHDLGKLLIAVGAGDSYEGIVAALQNTGASPRDAEREVLGCDHAELSAVAMERWKLPVAIRSAVHYHHNPDASRTEADAEYGCTLAHIIEVADECVNAMGISVALEESNPRADVSSSLRRLGLQEQAPQVIRSFETDYEIFRLAS